MALETGADHDREPLDPIVTPPRRQRQIGPSEPELTTRRKLSPRLSRRQRYLAIADHPVTEDTTVDDDTAPDTRIVETMDLTTSDDQVTIDLGARGQSHIPIDHRQGTTDLALDPDCTTEHRDPTTDITPARAGRGGRPPQCCPATVA